MVTFQKSLLPRRGRHNFNEIMTVVCLLCLRQAREEEQSVRGRQPTMFIDRDAKTLERSVAEAQQRGMLVRIMRMFVIQNPPACSIVQDLAT